MRAEGPITQSLPMRVDPFEQERVEAGRVFAQRRFENLPSGMTAAQRRAYFRDATRRRELIFGPEVRVHTPPNSFPPKICGVG